MTQERGQEGEKKRWRYTFGDAKRGGRKGEGWRGGALHTTKKDESPNTLMQPPEFKTN